MTTGTHSPTIIDRGCDWLQSTVQREDERWTACQNNWLDIVHVERKYCGLIEDAGMLGYVGLLTGKVFWGTRWDGSIIRITGGDAKKYWYSWLRATGKPTRIDMQVTLRCGDTWPEYLRAAHEGARAANAKLGEKRKRKLRVQTDDDQGHTLYIGSRASKTFGRIYHKWPTDKDRYQYGDIRMEVEVHAEEAALLMESYHQSGLGDEQYATGYVMDWFQRRGVTLYDGDCEVVNSRFTDVLDANPLTDKLNWLYNQVGPSVRLLSEQGHTAEVFRVLFGPQWLEVLLGRLTEEGGTDDGEEG